VGYKAKQGYCIYRVRVKRGDRKKRVAKASFGNLGIPRVMPWVKHLGQKNNDRSLESNPGIMVSKESQYGQKF
jgi:ribosomal protein L15E